MRAGRVLAGLAIALGLGIAGPCAAESLEEPPAARLVRMLDLAGLGEVAYAEKSERDGAVTLRGVTAKPPGGGHVEVASVSASGLAQPGYVLSASSLSLSGVAVSASAGASPLFRAERVEISAPALLIRQGAPARLRFDRLAVTRASASAGGMPVLGIESAEVRASRWLPGHEAALASFLSVKGAVAAGAVAGLNPPGREVLPKGSDLTFDLTAGGEIDDAGVGHSTLVVDTNHLGKLTVQVRAEGMKSDLFTNMASLQDSLRTLSANPGAPKGLPPEAAQGLIRNMASVKLVSAAMKAERLQWAGGAVDDLAKSKGVSRDVVANSLATVIGAKLSLLASPDRANRIGKALSSFLAKPNTLAIILRPSEPISPLEGMAGIRTGARPFDRLGLEVVAE